MVATILANANRASGHRPFELGDFFDSLAPDEGDEPELSLEEQQALVLGMFGLSPEALKSPGPASPAS